MELTRRQFGAGLVGLTALGLAGCAAPAAPAAASRTLTAIGGTQAIVPGKPGSFILGSPTKSGALVNTLTSPGMDVLVQYGTGADKLTQQTETAHSTGGEPVTLPIEGMPEDSSVYYRVATKTADGQSFLAGPTQTFRTARGAGKTFSFGVQGDSHPERPKQMFDATLYVNNLKTAAASGLDFYVMMGDDFSIEKAIDDGTVSQATVDAVYQQQRGWLDALGATTPIYTVNGNHEQAAMYLLDGTPHNPAVYAGTARNKYYPMPEPGNFYSGDATKVENIGLLRDYYAFEWGDALFAVIDLYWHTPTAVDNSVYDSATSAAKGGKATKGARDLWNNTLGKEQYDWLTTVLSQSTAKHKFVFSHHVLGTGRGGVEVAGQYEWGGREPNGNYTFPSHRANWAQPIHQLMVKYGVTIFFQGHDHLYARQQADGVTYQTVPLPADPTFTAFNADAYKSGTVLPNSGFLKVTVSPGDVVVDYVANGGANSGKVIHSYRLAS
jgi:hypothetical protein